MQMMIIFHNISAKSCIFAKSCHEINTCPFTALALLVGRQEEHLASKKLSDDLMA